MSAKKDGYEKQLAELKECVDKLESGVSLDESVELYERGLKAAKGCLDIIQSYDARIDELNKVADGLFDGDKD